ncbi:MAG: hypothetical protein ABI758_07125, partial [Candidatus Woesebacteria bacterium]
MRPTHEQDLFDLSRLPVTDIATKNTENLIGSVSIPVGMTIIRFIINDTEYERIVPLATYEGALVASINRGAKAISESNGARVMVEKRGVTRAPVFSCQNQAEAKKLALWLEKTPEVLEAVTRTTSAHTHYLSHHSWIR